MPEPGLVGLIVRQGVRLATVGLVAGSGLALAAARLVQSLLFQQSAKDPAVFGLAGVLLIGVALIASVVPAAKAMRADPSSVLRGE